ncbi:tetratricopeptide repeat protein [Patescibacteria group bacterium]|nr:tetratricopeptide repeat protein [Patescibacteria group bacterium]
MVQKKFILSLIIIGIILLIRLNFEPVSFAETIGLNSGEKKADKVVEKTNNLESVEEQKHSGDPLEKASSSIVHIFTKSQITGESNANGFIVDKNGVLLTSYHVIAGAKEAIVELKNGAEYRVVSVVYYDELSDACILKINATNLPVSFLGDSDDIHYGDKVYFLTDPYNLNSMFSEGSILGIQNNGSTRKIQFSGHISFGHSGSPLLNSQCEVIGIIHTAMFSSRKEKEWQNFNYATAINSIKPHVTTSPLMSLNEFLDKTNMAISYFIKGNAAIERRDFNQALSFYKRVIEINPDYLNAWYELGATYMELGQYQEAIPYFQKVLKLDPNNIFAYYGLGIIYMNLKQYQLAIANLNKTLQIEHNFPETYANLGIIYYSQGQYQKAKDNFQKAKNLLKQEENHDILREIEEYLKKIP